jgi:hypothetical protein
MRIAAALGLVLALAASRAVAAPAAVTPTCAPLPVPAAPILRVTPAQAARLPALVASASAGTTVLLADGTYRLRAPIRVVADRIALRSASGRPGAVVLDGAYAVGELVSVEADDVLIGELTLERAGWHLVHAVPPAGRDAIARLILYRLSLVDSSQQFVKVNPHEGGTWSVDRGRVECSTFALTAAGRPHVSTVLPCYTGGIDVHAGRSWEVRLNRFTGISCANGLAEHAVHFWAGSRGTLVERNTIVDCARGIGFGLGDRGHVGGIVRNNVVVATRPVLDTGIGLENASGARVLHNTVWVAPAAAKAHYSSIDVRFPGTSAEVRDNLTARITVRDGGHATLAANAENVPGSWFVAPARGDFHLRPGAAAVDRGVAVTQAGLDLDGQRHDAGRPDLGADEAQR